MKKNKVFKLIYKYRWLLIFIYLAIASLSSYIAVISAKSPTFKYEIRCLELDKDYKEVTNDLKFKNEVTFCSDNLAKDNLNGFYKENSDYIYLDKNNLDFEKTIYHEYSHFLMSKKVKNSSVTKLIKSMNLTDEKLTDITAFFLLLELEQGELNNVTVSQFSYLQPEDLYSLDNSDFWSYLDEIYTLEGIDGNGYTTFDRWVKSTNEKNS